MGDKGKRDKGKREDQKKAKQTTKKRFYRSFLKLVVVHQGYWMYC
jgi:hypothetical protein